MLRRTLVGKERGRDLISPVVPLPQQEETQMGLTHAEGAGPFTKFDKQTVIGTLKATGTRDPDILHAQKQQLLAPSKNLRMASYVIMGCSALLTITIVAAFAGIPFGLLGIWLWRRSSKNIATVEAAYSEYLASSPA
jgi:hypothetical protein